MTVVQIHEELPPSVIISPLWRQKVRDPNDGSVVDISNLVLDSPNEDAAATWIELPLLGEDGRVTGVLCRRSPIGVPGPSRIDADVDATAIYVHDIANVLAVIDGGLRLLDVRSDTDERAMIVERLHRAVRQGASLSRRLLDASKPNWADVRQPANHGTVFSDVSDMLDRTFRADVAVEAAIDPCLRCFSVDPEALHLALLNLCKNAADAMPDGGTIVIGARNVLARPGDPWVEVTVHDSGTGMTADVLSHVFEPYYTTKDPGTGTGLGLGQVKRFVESNRGALSVESVESEGTTVRMLFPAA
jgi:signal transduction histidine kinase